MHDTLRPSPFSPLALDVAPPPSPPCPRPQLGQERDAVSCQASSLTAERDSLGQQLRGMRADVDRLGAERDSWMRQAREAVAALRAVPAPTLPPPPSTQRVQRHSDGAGPLS